MPSRQATTFTPQTRDKKNAKVLSKSQAQAWTTTAELTLRRAGVSVNDIYGWLRLISSHESSDAGAGQSLSHNVCLTRLRPAEWHGRRRVSFSF